MTTANTKPSGRFARKQAPAVDVPVVRFDDVTKIYDGGSVGLEGASMRIGRGEFVFLVGPTGCGKPTCIRLLMKELKPSKGEMEIAGRTLSDMPRIAYPTCVATSAWSSRTTSCCPTAPSTTTWPIRCR